MWFARCRDARSRSCRGCRGISVVHHYIEQGLAVGRSGDVLMLEGSTHHLNQLTEFAQLVMTQTVVYGIAFYKVLFENAVCPLTELDTTLALYTITYGDDNIEVVERYRLLYTINV